MAPACLIEFSGQRESQRCSASSVMGKSKKFSSKGVTVGFVPDFRHAVETVAESEGFGCSGRVDAMMTVSDDSSIPKRKCISLNVGSDNFGIPLQVLSLAKMSRPEKKELKSRLKKELGQIEILQHRLASIPSDATARSPCSDVHSWSDGRKRSHLESSELSARNGYTKQRGVCPNKGSQSRKKGSSRRPEYAKSATPAETSISAWFKQCETFLNRLMTHNFGWVFNTPVDTVKLNIPDYFNVIKHPMDLGTVKSKLVGGEYSSPSGFAADVRLTFSNAMTYNPRGNDVHFMAETLCKNFETRWKSLEKKINVSDAMDLVPAYPANSGTRIESQMPPLKKKKGMPVDDSLVEPLLEKRIMSDEEKHKLSMELETLLEELPESIVDFLKEQSSGAEKTDEDEIEIDIDALGDDALFKLRRLVDDYFLEKQKRLTKAEPRGLELHNELGVSNSMLSPSKGNDAIDEDVDVVGGNDPPLSSFPPVEIEKNAVQRDNKCGSSSSSGSESGSTSRDSDPGSSSGGEADAAEVSRPARTAKEDFTHENSEQDRQPLVDINDECVNSGPEFENFQPNYGSADVDARYEEENAQSEIQVSPEKLYRAALLRSRFADTILKAQEKALEQGEKVDPDKLQMEKEELEKRAREEKARIQAEAKTAEEARKRAEAKVAGEARRKRELERELARQALQKMEKTVHINENSELMEDLEILRVTRGDDVPNFSKDASPELSENHSGSFKLQSDGNPLEQLGLYRKADNEDDDEEGGPSRSIDTQAKDVEEEGEQLQSVDANAAEGCGGDEGGRGERVQETKGEEKCAEEEEEEEEGGMD